ncbi:MAG: DUF58 domain-containing protein [Hyphomonadaceae bacterium]
MTNLSALRIEADALARRLPRLSAQTRASDAAHLGSAGRRRAGTGEDFWEYRRYTAEDDASRVDWRRSARGDALFVRETELETARSLYFWVDSHAGFHWSSDTKRPTKADRARIISMAMANLLSREGERVGLLGSGQPAAFGKRALERLYQMIASSPESRHEYELTAPKRAGAVIIASDFYDPVDTWAARLAPIAATCRDGVLVAISDPTEIDFPFKGRVRLSRPGTALQRILGRAETVQSEYAEKFEENRAALTALAGQLGWRLITHSTGDDALTAGAQLHAILSRHGDAV